MKSDDTWLHVTETSPLRSKFKRELRGEVDFDREEKQLWKVA